MKPPRGLSAGEQAAWARLAESVTPLEGRSRPDPVADKPGQDAKPAAARSGAHIAKASTNATSPKPRPDVAAKVPKALPTRPRAFANQLDSHWNRRLKAGEVSPDYTLDLHGHTLDGAYDRVMDGLDQARAMGARLVLVVAGRERPVDPADRGQRRGAIRAKLLDWLAASRHADTIAAIRRAHIRHGGEGALYLVLKRSR
ncbi:MAG: Smr/MutS family protein [Erythrobacter sp.]